MKNKRYRKLGLILGAGLLVIVLGCQAIAGLNLNQMLLNQLDVVSMEGRAAVEWDIEFDEARLADADPETRLAVEWLGKGRVELNELKMNEKGDLSLRGVAKLGKGDIGFRLRMDDRTLVADLSGAKRSLVLDVSEDDTAAWDVLFPGVGAMLSDDEKEAEMTASARAMFKQAASYFVNNLPNPPSIRVERAAEPVNGTPVMLSKIHAELNGDHLEELIPAYLDALVTDEDGLRDMMKTVIDWASGLAIDFNAWRGVETELPEEELARLLDEGVQEMLLLLQQAQEEWPQLREEDPEAWDALFGENLSIVADLYVDNALQLRKMDTTVKLDLAGLAALDDAEELPPVRAITLRMTEERWNVNGDVEIPAVQRPALGLTEEELGAKEPYEIVRLFEEDSALYLLLKDDLKIDDQQFSMSSVWGVPFYETERGADVPISWTLDYLGIEVKYKKADETLRFYDNATGRRIVLQIGSDEAVVNGEVRPLSAPVYLDHGTAYMDADDLFGLIGAEYEIWTYEDESIMNVTRDL